MDHGILCQSDRFGGPVTGYLRQGLTLAGFAVMAGFAYLAARHWQAMQPEYTRVATVNDCDLRTGSCRQLVGGGQVTLSIAPRGIPLMQNLQLEVRTAGLAVRGLEVEIRGLNMDMGLNRTVLQPAGDDRWVGETILPLCSQRRMQWEAAVRLNADWRVEVPFLFQTKRP